MSLASLWASGRFAESYLHRNRDAGRKRGPWWKHFLDSYPVRSALEVGCNNGANLKHLASRVPVVVGVDVSHAALADAMTRIQHDIALVAGRATDLSLFPDRRFDLVLSCGLLIHLPDEDLAKVLGEMWRVSKKYVLAMEYHADVRTEVKYRDNVPLIKRPYRGIASTQFGRSPIALGFAGKEDGFDDVEWNLWTSGCKFGGFHGPDSFPCGPECFR